MKKLTFVEKSDLLERYAKTYQKLGLRRGQSLFNSLAKIDSSLANEIVGTDIDCFYRDDLAVDFVIAVLQRWYKECN